MPARRRRKQRDLTKTSILSTTRVRGLSTAVDKDGNRRPFSEKHVGTVIHKFLDFERKHYWNSGRINVFNGSQSASDTGEVFPLFNVNNDPNSGRDVPKKLKEAIIEHCGPLTTKIAQADVSSDGNTIKLLVQLQDGFKVESVIMRHKDPKSGRYTRATLCVSSQVGCKMGCKFCATGTLGELGNLTSGEILEQLVHANRVNDAPMRNVVFMGMGEPLNNYNNVTEAVRTMISTRGFGLAASRVTVSTVGIVPRMEQLVVDLPQVSMALSLHAPTQEMRAEIVPAARGWNMARLMAALDEYTRVTGRAALIQYILLAELNDTPEIGAVLADLLHGRNVKLNLIPYNPNFAVGIMEFQEPSPERVERFMKQLRNAGIFTTLRKEMGQDVSGACGQLALTAGTRSKRDGGTSATDGVSGSTGSQANSGADIEDLMRHKGQAAQQTSAELRESRRLRRRRKRDGSSGSTAPPPATAAVAAFSSSSRATTTPLTVLAFLFTVLAIFYWRGSYK